MPSEECIAIKPCGCQTDSVTGMFINRCDAHERKRLKRLRWRHRRAARRGIVRQVAAAQERRASIALTDAMREMGLSEAMDFGLENVGAK